MALKPYVGSWLLFQFLDPIHSRQDSLDGGSAGRKAATYTQNNTNRINAHNTDIDALSGIPTYDFVFQRAKTVHALDRAATVIGSNYKYHSK
jgi:hypothetical protein